MNGLVGFGIALLVGGGVGLVTYVIIKVVESRLPGYSPVDEKTRKMEKYMERQKQGMR